MSWYPQTGAGSVAQFPLSRTRKWRAITNWLENDERVVLADAASKEIEWKLRYEDLSDAEAGSLTALFAASKGGYMPFGFIDPTANLLGWSEDLLQPDWSAGLLSVTGGAEGPGGADNAWTLVNGTAGDQSLEQTVGIPSEYTACFSVWLWSAVPTRVVLSRDGITKVVTAGPKWVRGYVTGRPGTAVAHSTLGITVASGQTVRMWGPQAEAQPYPSQYKPVTAPGGIYEETYFSSDELRMTNTAPGLSSCAVTLVSRG